MDIKRRGGSEIMLVKEWEKICPNYFKLSQVEIIADLEDFITETHDYRLTFTKCCYNDFILELNGTNFYEDTKFKVYTKACEWILKNS